EKRVFLVILFTSFSGSLVSRISGAVQLTKAQADAQELKNAREEGLVLETELFTFILQRVAQEISGILVRVPLTLQRKYPDISPSHLDVVKTEIAKASNVAAKAGENVGRWIDDFRRTEGS
uniref:terminase small subunit n=1 Tax=Escherichia coli TaxID=562 RepID=UPI001FCE7ACE